MKEAGPVVLLATGSDVLDAALIACGRWRTGGQVLYREAVAAKAGRSQAAVVVLACSLPGGGDIMDVIYDLRRRDVRVVFLAGDRENADYVLLDRAVGLGVYDLVFDPVRPEEVMRAILEPAGFARASVWLEGNGRYQGGPVRRAAPDLWNRLARCSQTRGPDRPAALAEEGAQYQAGMSAPGDRPPAADSRLVAFAAPRDGVGRSFLAAAFGLWLAGRGEDVVLLDGGGREVKGPGTADMRSRSHRLWGARPAGREGGGRTVLVTLPAAAAAGTPAVLAAAAGVFLVSTPERSVFYDAQREFYYYRHLGLEPGRVHLVVNRRSRRRPLRLGEMGGLLPLSLCTVVPECGATPEGALRGRRFRRCMADLERAVLGSLPDRPGESG